MKKKKSSLSTLDLYDNNLQRLMDLSKIIDQDNEYPPETQNSSIFIKLLFQDIRKCSKWYGKDEWRPIKTAIHNCYKLLQKGYVPENQGELENNIKILEKLLKTNVDKASEEVVQNIFDKSIKNLYESNINNINNNNNKIKNISNKIYKEDDKSENFFNYDNKNEFVTKEKMKNMLDEQKLYYENKMNIMQGEIDDLKKKVNDLSQIIENIGKCFIKPISKGSK